MIARAIGPSKLGPYGVPRSMSGLRFLWMPLLLIGAWLGSLSGNAAQRPVKKITFLTNYVFIGRHAPFFVGQEKGFFRDAGFDIRISPATGSAFVLTALEGGTADYGMAEAGSVVQASRFESKWRVMCSESKLRPMLERLMSTVFEIAGGTAIESPSTPRFEIRQPVAGSVTAGGE